MSQFEFDSLFSSIEPAFVVGPGCVLILFVLLRIVRPKLASLSPSVIGRDESGSYYTISLVLVLPLYVLLICLIIESALMMVAKMGTVYSAYSAGRSAMVWLPGDPVRKDMVQLAAVQSMTPFASSFRRHQQHSSIAAHVNERHNRDYFAAYRRMPSNRQTRRYVSHKRNYAALATTTEIEAPANDPDGEITVTVNYEFPFNLPGAGRVFGRVAPWPGAHFRTRTITSTVRFTIQGPRGRRRTLGIGYAYDH
ncbi:MAG: hypothetical protein O3A00_27105 [Planctomycetota bacterium]|nr:hypothetical protein [Planctomycetota bacterium]